MVQFMSRMRFANSFLHGIERFYNQFILWGSRLQSIFILYMRATWGHQLFLIGKGKLEHMDATVHLFESLGFAHPVFLAQWVGITELICGLLLFLGFASRLAAISVLCIMTAALATAHAHSLNRLQFLLDPFLLTAQAPYPFLIMAFLVLAFGPGRVSIDAWLKRWSERQVKY